jgi:hypothetical protein
MTRSDPYHNDYPCPGCEEDVSVPLPPPKYVTCPECHAKLEINVDAEWFDGMWHDRTSLSLVDPEQEHIKRMVDHAKRMLEE